MFKNYYAGNNCWIVEDSNGTSHQQDINMFSGVAVYKAYKDSSPAKNMALYWNQSNTSISNRRILNQMIIMEFPEYEKLIPCVERLLKIEMRKCSKK